MGSGEGRIPSQAFTGSLSAFLAICLIISAVRCYIRFGVLREYSWEDGLFISGVVFLIVGIALLFKITDTLYESERLLFGDGIMALDPSDLPDLLNRQSSARTVIIVGLSLMWLTLSCVKFCFLLFFKKLIRQMPKMIKFWWVAVVFNVAASIYGFLTFYVPCPLFKKSEMLESIQCHQEGARLNLLIAMSWAQMATDIFGDVLILTIPLILIRKIRIGWSQKVALAFSLCLTIVVIILTIIRIVGLKFLGKVDPVWQTWCIAISAEIGLSLVAVSAFRALYVAKAKDRRVNRTITSFGWYNKGLSIFRRITNTNSTRSDEDKKDGDFLENDIPHGTMTGMRTFIDGNGKTRFYETMDEEV